MACRMKPDPTDITAAAARIAPYVRHTPVMRLAAGDFGLAYPVTLKLELLQHAGSFKPRSRKIRPSWVIAALMPTPAGAARARTGRRR